MKKKKKCKLVKLYLFLYMQAAIVNSQTLEEVARLEKVMFSLVLN